MAHEASRGVPDPGQANVTAASSPYVQGEGDRTLAVDELLAAHADAVYRYALRLTRHAPAAQDLMQETMLRGWKSRRRLREPAAARVWLLRIATNLHRDRCRAARPTEPIVAEPRDSRPTAPARAEQREAVAQALEELDNLPPRQREVMHLVTVEQLTHQEAADLLEITVDALKASLSLARKQLRERLSDLYLEYRGVRAGENCEK